MQISDLERHAPSKASLGGVLWYGKRSWTKDYTPYRERCWRLDRDTHR
jgi:hypothetical protein